MANTTTTATDPAPGHASGRRRAVLSGLRGAVERSWPSRHWTATLLVLGTVLWMGNGLAFYPGFMSFDSVMQLGQALDLSTVADWHPPVMTALWWLLMALTGGSVGSMLVAQLGLLWAGLTLLAVHVFRRSGRRLLSLLPLLLGVLPHVASMSAVIWKDGQLAFALLGAVVLLIFVRRGVDRAWVRWCAVAVAVLLLAYAGAVRYNALPAIIPLLFLLTWPGMRRARRYRVALAAAVLAGALVATPVIDAVRPVEETHPAASIMLDDVLHLYTVDQLRSADVSPPLRDYLVTLATTCPPETRDVNYTWRCANTTGTIPSAFLTHADELRDLYLRGIAEQPQDYAGFRLRVFGKFLHTPPEEVFVSWLTIGDNPYGLVFEPNPASRALETYVGVTARNFGFVYMPWAWLLAALVVLALGWRRRASAEHAGVVLALAASSVLYVVTYLPMVIGYDYRYVYWPTIAVSVAVVLLLLDRRTREASAGSGPADPSGLPADDLTAPMDLRPVGQPVPAPGAPTAWAGADPGPTLPPARVVPARPSSPGSTT
ncbi:hypothetical protein SAMN05660350_03734 [Geodermatophilus obscurus]|uniref:Uncharacterized protein n=1 Tax=Geodermatophilus obscurus TaxID=1861 RepID=A0A1M7UQK4_9ACTN|nr:hypothetical protein [Geodermatophilus obscurus]SHN85239.1 hypothetical protein SAMN05660350_03734 [Geodermatophilus obscurus]